MTTWRETRKRHRARRGFTLLEVIVVVTIIALLAGVVGVNVFKTLGRGKIKVAETETASIAQAVSLYLVDQGLSRPPDDFELEALVVGEDPYIDTADAIVDPWQNPYIIISPGEVHSTFDVVSMGEDGQLGTEDDIVNK